MEQSTRALLPTMMDARDSFMELVEDLRPELHRYCARMTGSIFDGEDVVQDTLAKAYYALGQMMEPPNLKPWIFRIAHNTAMDFLKRHERKNVELVSDVPERAEPQESSVDPALVEAALSVFVVLPPVQRSAVILKDVLGHSLEGTAMTMGTTVAAVKAALARARANLAHASPVVRNNGAKAVSAQEQARLRRYVELFNDRNWDALRALLAEESQLDIVSRVQRRVADAGYYDRYAEMFETEDLRAEAGIVDGLAVVAIFKPASSREPAYFIQLSFGDSGISQIRDFCHVPYIAADARFSAMPSP